MLKSLIEANNLITGNKIEATSFSRILSHLTNNAVATISAYRTHTREAYHKYGPELNENLPKGISKYDEAWEKLLAPYKVSKAKNKARHKSLELELRALCNKVKGGYKGIKGRYKEGGTGEFADEQSFIVWCSPEYQDQFKQTLLHLGTKYEQDAITYQPYEESFSMLNTSPDDISANGKVSIGHPIINFKGKSFGKLEYTDPTDIQETKTGEKVIIKYVAEFMSILRGRPFYWTGWDKSDWDKANKQGARVVTDEEYQGIKSMYKGTGRTGFMGAMISSANRHKSRLLDNIISSSDFSISEHLVSTSQEAPSPENNEEIVILDMVECLQEK